jgi:hypothetical protein
MKNITKLSGIIICFLLTVTITAQTRVNASDIMRDIKKGKDITYKNVTIVGDLDFTFMDEQLNRLPKRRRNFWNNSSNNKIEKQINGKVSFKNCTFQDNVFAYIHDEDSGYTFVANFDDIAIFKNCVFKETAMFKYSHFRTNADFSDSKFNGDSTFKYANFKRDISFSNTIFGEESTFKYTTFNNNVSFAKAIFKESATFKYTKFKDGVSFNRTRFEEDLDFKYTKVNGKFDIAGMHVEYDVDSKYASINGNKFSYH